ncbi:hypothetical protein TWF694_000748 [Orbilia ellipsospora]|uniref:Uncharacterized protein n=1 Tax=Orbilia ellipsospora TaxID=2528407 RepID=A0AAV9XS51_9PEZI
MWRFLSSPYLTLSFALLLSSLCRAQTATTSVDNFLTIVPGPDATAVIFPATCSQIIYPQSNPKSRADALYFYAYYCDIDGRADYPTNGDRECCPANYYHNYGQSSIQFDEWDLEFAQDVCPYGADAQILPYASIGGQVVNYCCPRSFTTSVYSSTTQCVTTVRPTATTDLPRIILATPLFLVNSTVVVTTNSDAEDQKEAHDLGVRIGIGIAISVPIIAGVAFLTRMYMWRRERIRMGDDWDGRRRPFPRYIAMGPVRRPTPCTERDSEYEEPPPPYNAAREGGSSGDPSGDAHGDAPAPEYVRQPEPVVHAS